MTDSFSQTKEDKRSMATAAGHGKKVEVVKVWLDEHKKGQWSAYDLYSLIRLIEVAPSPTDGASSLGDARAELVGNAGAAGQLSALREKWENIAEHGEGTPMTDNVHFRCAMERCAAELKLALAVRQSEREEPWCDLCGHTGWLRDSDGNRTERCACVAAAAPKPADLGQEQTHFCQNTKQIELTSLSACSCVEPDAFKPAPACEAPNWIAVVERLEADSLAWDDKNDDRPLPSAQGSTDYVYGYNAGVSEGFRAASVRVRALAASVPPPTGGK